MSKKRFTIKPQDDYWAVVDNYNDDKVCIINGIHTEIEAIWLCDFMNEQQATINRLEEEIKLLKPTNIEQYEQIQKLQEENKQLKLTLSEYGVDLKAFEIFKQKIGYYDKVIDDE